MDISLPVTSEITRTKFTFFNSQEVRNASVKLIHNPEVFDALNTPTSGGLYDAALGPLSAGSVCSTCSLNYYNCPGHFGHIELPCPVINPLLFDDALSLSRACCFYCHHLRNSREDTIRTAGKLRLLKRGFLYEAKAIDTMKPLLDKALAAEGIQLGNEIITKQAVSAADYGHNDDNDQATDAMAVDSDNTAHVVTPSADRRETHAEFKARVDRYVESVLDQNDGTSQGAYQQTAIMAELEKTISELWVHSKSDNCRRCGARNPKLIRDGYNKVLKVGLSARMVVKNGMREEEDLLSVGKPSADDYDNLNGNGMTGNASDDDEDDFGTSQADANGKNVDQSVATGFAAIAKNEKKFIAPGQRTLFTPLHMRSHLRMLFNHEWEVLELVFGRHRPRSTASATTDAHQHEQLTDMFFIEVLPVSPNRFRPAAIMNGRTSEHVHNHMLSSILTTSIVMRRINAALAGEPLETYEGDTRSVRLAVEKLVRQKSKGTATTVKHLMDTWATLQQDVNNLIDNARGASNTKIGGPPLPGIRQNLEKKEGLFRMHMMGKRVNYSARSVISPDPNLETNEVGIPPVFALRLTTPEPVTHFNVKELRQAVINGHAKWPGATHVVSEDGTMTNLERLSHESRVALANQLLTPQDVSSMASSVSSSGNGVFAPRTMGVNKKVVRHIRNGDYVLLNRQPTLHKPSIMAHRVKVLPGEKTIRMHYANCNTYNADFDGDEMNIHYPQNELARAEAAYICKTDLQYLVPTSGNPLRGLIQDHVVMGMLMTKRDTFFDREQYQQLLYGSLRPEDDDIGDSQRRIVTLPPTVWKPVPRWTGKQVISTILLNLTYGMSPPNIVSKPKVPATYWGKDSEEGQVLVVDGELLTGILDKSQFGAAAYGLVHSLYELYSPALAGKMLSILSRLFTRYSQMRGFTCRMDDLLFSADGEQMRREALAATKNCGIEVAVDYVGLADMITDPHNMTPDQRREFHLRMEEVLRDDLKMRGLDAMMKNRTSAITSGANTTCMPSGLYRKFPKNHMQAMTITGAKGSDINALQISGLLGQQELEGRRVPVMISGKSLPSFRPFETHIRAGGYISSRFLTGIKPQEYYFHCMAGREGLIDTAVKTANSGYLQRCLIKHLEGIRVEYDHTVRDADGSLVQFYYGEDGLDVVKQKHLYQFDFVASNYNALKAKHKPKDAIHALDIETAKKFAKKALKKPEKYPPVMSQLVPSRYLGSVSEKFHHGLSEYISTNPRQLLASKYGVANRKGQFGAMAHDECNKRTFQALMELQYMRSLADPGEAVGLLAAQGIGEPSTQMTLNTFHLAGFGAKNVTLGIPRLREIVMTASATPRTPSMTLDLLPEITEAAAQAFCKRVTRLSLSEVIDCVQVQEELTSKTGHGFRFKTYTLRFNFYDRQSCLDEYAVTTSDIKRAIIRRFIPLLDTVIRKQLRMPNVSTTKIGKDQQLASHNDGGDDAGDSDAEAPAGSGRKSRTKRDPSDDMASFNPAVTDLGDDGQSDEDVNDENDDEEGDAKQAMRRKARQRDFLNAGSDDEEGVPSDKSNSDNDDDDDGKVDSDGELNDEFKQDLDALDQSVVEKSQQLSGNLGNVKDSVHLLRLREKVAKVTGSSPGGKSAKVRWSSDRNDAELGDDAGGDGIFDRPTRKEHISPFVVNVNFDHQNGEFCELTIKLSAGTPKLLLVSLVEAIAPKAVIRQVPSITRCFPLAKENDSDSRNQIATDGVNLKGIWEFSGVFDHNSMYTNDIHAVLNTYGVEAARSAIMMEISQVFGAYGIDVNARHISLLADYMTFEGGFKPFNRIGIRSNASPLAKMSFESTVTFLRRSSMHGDLDKLVNPSSRIVVGQPIMAGTGSFDIVQNMHT